MAARASGKKKAAKKKAPTGAQGSRGKVAKADPKTGIGHNSGRVSAALIKDHHEKITAIEERLAKKKSEFDTVKGQLRSAYAMVKQDGIQVDDFKLARELDKRDHGSVITGYANTGEYLRAIKSDLAIQMDLFQSIDIPLPADAKLAGTHAFSNKEPRTNNPFQQGTEEFVEWDGAWMAAGDKVDLSADDGATKH